MTCKQKFLFILGVTLYDCFYSCAGCAHCFCLHNETPNKKPKLALCQTLQEQTSLSEIFTVNVFDKQQYQKYFQTEKDVGIYSF